MSALNPANPIVREGAIREGTRGIDPLKNYGSKKKTRETVEKIHKVATAAKEIFKDIAAGFAMASVLSDGLSFASIISAVYLSSNLLLGAGIAFLLGSGLEIAIAVVAGMIALAILGIDKIAENYLKKGAPNLQDPNLKIEELLNNLDAMIEQGVIS